MKYAVLVLFLQCLPLLSFNNTLIHSTKKGIVCCAKAVYATGREPLTLAALGFSGFLIVNHYATSCDSVAQSIMEVLPFIGVGTGVTVIKNLLPDKYYPQNKTVSTALEHPFALYSFITSLGDFLKIKYSLGYLDTSCIAIAGISGTYLCAWRVLKSRKKNKEFHS